MYKKFFALLVSVLLICSMSIPAFASESQPSSISDNTVVLYQDENLRIYQSREITPRVDDNYGYAWVDSQSRGSFTVNCTFSGNIYGTFKVESSNREDNAQMTISGPMNQLPISLTVYAYMGDVYFDFTGSSGQYTINYLASTSSGMRMMCWLYSNAPN